MTTAKTRISVKMPKEIYLEFEDYAKELNCAKGRLFMDSFRLYKRIKTARKQGYVVFVRLYKNPAEEKVFEV